MKKYAIKKINSLTSLRFLMICMIVAHHMGFWDEYNIYRLHFHNASIAVDYFFVLSGFGLTYAKKDKYWNGNAEIKSLYKYAFMRMKKIYPLYLATMLAYIPWQVYTYYIKDGRELSYTCAMTSVKVISVIPMLQSVTGRSSFTHALNSVGWFLSTLFVLYMFYPKLSEWNQKYILNKRRVKVSVIILLIFYCIIAKFFYMIEEHTFFDELEYCSPLIRVIPFTLGILICDFITMEKLEKNKWVTANNSGGACTAHETVAIAIFLVWYFLRDAVLPGSKGHTLLIGKEIIDIIIVMYVIYVFSKEKGRISRLLNHNIMVMLGNISMYIYLIHAPVITYTGLFFKKLSLAGIYWDIFRTLLIIAITGLFTKVIIIMKNRKYVTGNAGSESSI